MKKSLLIDWYDLKEKNRKTEISDNRFRRKKRSVYDAGTGGRELQKVGEGWMGMSALIYTCIRNKPEIVTLVSLSHVKSMQP